MLTSMQLANYETHTATMSHNALKSCVLQNWVIYLSSNLHEMLATQKRVICQKN